MINLNAPLQRVMNKNDLTGIKPFALLIRNKWNGSNFALDTDNPIDITAMIVKPNTLSMTLDVNEVAQYKANNVTLTIYDPFNRFIEGTPLSFFPNGYQLYGSQVILYYGLDNDNRTPLFVGVIKDLPTHKPESYQVDLKLISPLELLNDIEAKDFSDKYEGETLTLHGQDDYNNPIYQTANTGVGGFSAIYADGVKMFEGIDYQISQLNELAFPALVTIKNTDLHSAIITADYFCWKRGLSIEQIISGLVALAGYIDNTDIRSVVWNTAVASQYSCSIWASFGFKKDNNIFTCYYDNIRESADTMIHLVAFYSLNFKITIGTNQLFSLTDTEEPYVKNGFDFDGSHVYIIQNYNEIQRINFNYIANGKFVIERDNNNYTFYITNSQGEVQETHTYTYNVDLKYLIFYSGSSIVNQNDFNFCFRNSLNEDIFVKDFSVVSNNDIFVLTDVQNFNNNTLKTYRADIQSEMTPSTYYRTAINYNVFDEWQQFNLGADVGKEGNYFQMEINFPFSTNFNNYSQSQTIGNILHTFIKGYIVDETKIFIYLLASTLLLELINLSNNSVLEALQDFALISGYEFGVDRQGVFFFRPRSQSTTPVYDLDHNEIVKIDNVQKKFNDFFTKLTLQFGQRPLEFYANEGDRPTPVDKYGIINKEIDKPDIVNYDNPELAQAIGPQLLAIYSNLADIIQLTGKLNLNLELGDVVNVKRNYPLTIGSNFDEYSKFIAQDTYYRACKITGLNYNFGKRQITYTLKNVSNENNEPQEVTDFKKPNDWVDLRKISPNNSIVIYVAHKEDYSQYDNFAFKVRCDGGYKVTIDSNLYGNYNDNTTCSITWSTSGITTGQDITTPEPLKAHIIIITPQTEGKELYLFKGERVAASGYEQQGSLWYHFNLDYPVDMWSMTAAYGSYYSVLLHAITAKDDLLRVNTSDFVVVIAQGSDLGLRSSQYIEYLPQFYATKQVTNVDMQTRLNPPLEYIRLVGEGNYKIKNHSFRGGIKQIKASNVILTTSNPWSAFQGTENLERLPQIDFSAAEDMGDFITNAVSLQDTILNLTSATSLKKIGCYGNSTYFMGGLKGLRVSNQAPFDNATAPQINVSYTGMSRSALRTLFTDLPTVSNGQIINVTGCTGNMLGEQGTVTFEDGIASGFSANDYYYFYKEFSETDKSWSIIIRAKVTDLSAVNTIISYGGNTKNSLQLSINTSSKLVTHISSNGSSNDIASGTQSSLTINTNTYYYFKIEYTGANYIISVSEDDINYTPYITIDNATPIYNGAKLSLGFNQSRWPEALSGSIDFNETYFIVNGKTWFDINNMLTNADKAIATGKGWTVAA